MSEMFPSSPLGSNHVCGRVCAYIEKILLLVNCVFDKTDAILTCYILKFSAHPLQKFKSDVPGHQYI